MAHSSNVLLFPLYQKIDEAFSAAKATRLKLLARKYFASSANSELASCSDEQLFDSLLEIWDFVRNRPKSSPQIQFMDDVSEEEPAGVRIFLLLDDMPFVVDSVRQCLNRLGVTIEGLNNCVLYTQRRKSKTGARQQGRHKKGELLELNEDAGKNFRAEALSCIRCAPISEEQQKLVRKELLESLRHVAAAVKAYQPMCSKVIDIRDRLLANAEQLPVGKEELKESVEFIDWIVNNHFTFLGYEEYRIRNRSGGKLLDFQSDSVLGVSRFKESLKKQVKLTAMPEGTAEIILANQLCSFAKSSQRSRVHRPAYYDYILIREFDEQGEVSIEHRFKGLYTSSVYYRPALDIPLVRKKVQKILDRSGFAPNGHSSKDLLQVINVFPRDELFQMNVEQLFDTAIQITQFQEMRTCKLFVRKDSYGNFFSCLIYVPRDIYTTRVRLKIQNFLSERLQASELEYNTYLSESILARLHLVLRVPNIHQVKYDLLELESSLVALVKPWEDYYRDALQEVYDYEEAARRYEEYANCFPLAYQEAYSAQEAVVHTHHLSEVNEQDHLVLALQRDRSGSGAELSFKIFSRQQQLMLSDIDPVLENLGLYIISEKTFKLRPGHCNDQSDGSGTNEGLVWLHDFSLYRKRQEGKVEREQAAKFENAFAAVWKGDVDDDSFNALVMTAELDWRDVALLRSYAAYLKQLQFGYTTQFIAETLGNHAALARELRNYFYLLFDPATGKGQRRQAGKLRKSIVSGIDEVSNLAEDSVLRAYLQLIDATLRCNFFQRDDDGKLKTYFSFKFRSDELEFMPRPKPKFEIFVYSRRMEGVHLRGGKVARGGLRWSDRSEDYRTEVLGLVKAQQVKNSVIVPVGAKGGFIVKEQPASNDRESVQELGIACYKTFISGLLDITDNMVDGKLHTPKDTVRRDDEDPYLVVAADKGTAAFSDIANGIADEYDFWLGDGFASGGSHGYDHKAMGITARGAWVSVQRHFRERGIDVQKEDFTVVGIGDMSGDVFGNGMLLSNHIRLQAAFNHRHIFIDPNPDAAQSFRERRRLFNKKGSSWSDYKEDLISSGGGVFERSAKSIAISDEMKACFAIDRDKMTPNQLISALLRAPVDLIWNGGIGTYVKSSTESHGEVGDKTNDALRVDGSELRCKVIGEGGNLGLTQRARIEYAQNGGVSLTDFIDNSAGVDCSDHEVNIKILLNQLQREGKLSLKRRYNLLGSMTDEVAELVLDNNFQQVQAIGIAYSEARNRHQEYGDLIRFLEKYSGLDRKLEFLPGDDELEERAARQQTLTRPELSVMISYMKLHLKTVLVSTDFIEDEYLTAYLYSAFPARLRKNYSDEILAHPLRKEIIASQLANRLVNLFGASFIYRMIDSTGAPIGDVVKAMLLSMEIYQIEDTWHEIENLDFQVSSSAQTAMLIRVIRLVRRSTRWLLRNRRSELNMEKEIAWFAEDVKRYRAMLPAKLPEDDKASYQARKEKLCDSGVDEKLANKICQYDFLFPATSFVEISKGTNESLADIVTIYYTLGEQLRLNWLGKTINELDVDNYWQALARETFLDDLAWQQRALTCNLVSSRSRKGSAKKQVEQWVEDHAAQIARLEQLLSQLEAGVDSDYAIYSVVLRELLNLAQNTAYRN